MNSSCVTPRKAFHLDPEKNKFENRSSTPERCQIATLKKKRFSAYRIFQFKMYFGLVESNLESEISIIYLIIMMINAYRNGLGKKRIPIDYLIFKLSKKRITFCT